MEIRKATIDDLDIIVQFNYNLALETEDKILDIERLTKGVRNLIEDFRRGSYYVCEVNGKIIGQIMYTYEWSDWRNGTFLWIQSVYVEKDYRNKGVFKNLYNYIKIKSNNDSNIVGIRLYVENKNTVAQEIYKKLGMCQCNYDMYEYIK